MEKISVINILSLTTVVLLLVVSPLVGAQETCWSWGGSSSASQGQFIKCPAVAPTVITVVRTEVREVKVPFPVPGPVQRIEAPAPQKEKAIKE